MAKPTYIQHTALGKLINGQGYGHAIAPKTMNVLEREGWVRDGRVTFAGRVAYWEGSHPAFRGSRPTDTTQAHECDEDCYQGYCDQMHYPQPGSIAHNANARTGVALGELRDV